MNCINRHALTLVEMMLSMVILAILLLGAQSAIMISARAMPTSNSTASRVVAASNVMDAFARELAYATSVPTMSNNTIEFTVADRNGDGQPETIRYSWSGIAGTPLTRTYNNSPSTVADKVQHFALTYHKTPIAQPTTYSEGSLTYLAHHDSGSLMSDASVTSSNWRAQYFTPSLPSDAVRWRVTRIWLQVRRQDSDSGVTKVQLRPAMNGVPSNVVLGESTLYENTLPSSYTWREINFSDTQSLGPSTAMCIVLQWVNGNESCEVRYRSYLLSPQSNYMLTGSGSSWSASNNSSLQFYVAGVVTTPNPIAYTYKLASVNCEFKTASNSTSTLSTSIRTLNEPQVAGP